MYSTILGKYRTPHSIYQDYIIQKCFAGDLYSSFLYTHRYRFVFAAKHSFSSQMNNCNRYIFCDYYGSFYVKEVHRHVLLIIQGMNNDKHVTIQLFESYQTSIHESNISVKFMCMANQSNQPSDQLFESPKGDHLPLVINIDDHSTNA